MTTKLWIDSGDQFGLVRNATHYVWDLMKKTRFFFYLANPYETMFPDLNVPRYAAEMFPVFVLLVTIENIIRFISGKKLSRINDSVASIGGAIFQDCFRVHIRSVEVICYCLVYNHFRLTTLPWNSLSTWFYCFLLVDLGFYWAHRLAHEVNFIWAIHQAHHSGEDFTLFAGIRQAFFQPLTAWYTYVWMGLIGIPPQIFLAHLQLTELYMLYIHTETIKSLGFLEYVFNCPSHHRVHHARNRKYIDKNYGGLFIFWDRLFGTFEQEDPKDPPIYGLVKPVESYNIFYLQFHSLVTMFRRIKATDGLRNKLAVVFKGPGWSPGKPRLGYYDDIPLIDEPVSYWDPEISAWKKIYVVWHTAMILAFYHFLTLHCNRFSQMMIFIGVISLLLSNEHNGTHPRK
ncbi:FCH domain only protein 2 [Sarcoptes scabiei]|nr:FCH domain only protein 2 [Sarcoptes scabiei]